MNILSEAYTRGQAARRNANATSVLEIGAMVGLFVGAVFWNNLFWLLIAPSGLVEMLLSMALAGGYAIILPMLLSLLAPSTPAGMALAETRHKTWGHAVAVAAELFMVYHAFHVVWAWWRSRPAVVETGQDLYLAIGTLIIFIVVPALSWVQIAPDRWVAEIVQAQQVKRLQAAQQANLMAAQLQYARCMALIKRGLANATAEERSELAGTLIAMQRAENEAITQVSDSMRLATGIDTGVRLLDDPHVEQQFHQLTDDMDRLYAPINQLDYVDLPPVAASVAAPSPLPQRQERELPDGRAPHQDARPALSPPASAVAAETAVAAPRSDSRRYAAELRAVAAATGAEAVFTARVVAETVGKSERTARDMLVAWLDLGWVARGEAANSYYITQEAS